MRFNFPGVYILRICNFRVFRVFKFAVAGYNGVEIFAGEIFADIQREPVYQNSIRQLQKCKTCWTRWLRLKMLSYWMDSCIWGFHIYKEVWMPFSGERLGCAHKSNREDRSLLQWKESLKRSAMYCARSRASVRSSCGSASSYPVKLQEAATKHRLITILVTHDVIDWLELCMCPLTVTFKYSWTKYSWMPADPRKPQTLNPAKITAHTVYICKIIYCIFLSM